MDSRDHYGYYGALADYPRGTTFDERTMTLSIPLTYEEETTGNDVEETFVFNCTYAVCNLCDGRGSHVNPSIDAHGIPAEEFHDDPDFAEEYFSGMYDIPCNKCEGRRVVSIIDEERSDKRAMELLNKWRDEEYAFRRMSEAERKYGA
jgi:hypothetical protein